MIRVKVIVMSVGLEALWLFVVYCVGLLVLNDITVTSLVRYVLNINRPMMCWGTLTVSMVHFRNDCLPLRAFFYYITYCTVYSLIVQWLFAGISSSYSSYSLYSLYTIAYSTVLVTVDWAITKLIAVYYADLMNGYFYYIVIHVVNLCIIGFV